MPRREGALQGEHPEWMLVEGVEAGREQGDEEERHHQQQHEQVGQQGRDPEAPVGVVARRVEDRGDRLLQHAKGDRAEEQHRARR